MVSYSSKQDDRSIDQDDLKVGVFGDLKLDGSYADYQVLHVAGGVKIIDLKKDGFGEKIFPHLNSLRFDDLSHISVHSKVPLHVTDIVPVSGSGPFIIDVATLLKNDVTIQLEL